MNNCTKWIHRHMVALLLLILPPVLSVVPAATAGAQTNENRVVAAVNWTNGKSYFLLANGDYFRFTPGVGIDEGYPLRIEGNWGTGDRSLEPYVSRLTAGFLHSNGKIYFFLNDGTYLRYTGGEGVDPGYPSPVEGNWPGLGPYATKISAAVKWSNDKVYMFLNDGTYLRYTPGPGVDSDYSPPHRVNGAWPAEVPYGSRSLGEYAERITAAVMPDGESGLFMFDDGTVQRYLTGKGLPSGPVALSELGPYQYPKYQVKIYTSDTAWAGTDDCVLMKLEGALGPAHEDPAFTYRNGSAYLNNRIEGNAFEQNQLDIVYIDAGPIGTIQKVFVELLSYSDAALGRAPRQCYDFYEGAGVFFELDEWRTDSIVIFNRGSDPEGEWNSVFAGCKFGKTKNLRYSAICTLARRDPST